MCSSTGRAIEIAIGEARAGDVVVIAGRGHETYQEFADHTEPFDDRVVARAVRRGLDADAEPRNSGHRRHAGDAAGDPGGGQAVPASGLGPAHPRRGPEGSLREAGYPHHGRAGDPGGLRPRLPGRSHRQGGFNAFRDSGLLALVTIVAFAVLGFLDDFIKIRKSRSFGLQKQGEVHRPDWSSRWSSRLALEVVGIGDDVSFFRSTAIDLGIFFYLWSFLISRPLRTA